MSSVIFPTLSYNVFLTHFQVLGPQQITKQLNLCRPSGKESFLCTLSYTFLVRCCPKHFMKVQGSLHWTVSFHDAYGKHRISLFVICCGLTTLKCISSTSYESVGKITLGILILCRHSGKESFQCYLSYSFLKAPFGNTFQGCGSSPANRKLICQGYR